MGTGFSCGGWRCVAALRSLSCDAGHWSIRHADSESRENTRKRADQPCEICVVDELCAHEWYERGVTRFFLALLALSACADPAVSPEPDPMGVDAGVTPSRPRVRLATFNVRRFFDTECQTGACTPTDYEEQATPQAFEARTAQLAQAILSLEADAVALEEVETQACLDALLLRLGPAMPFGVLGELGTPASVDVAVLSKTAIEKVVGHRRLVNLARADGSLTSFSRELLEVQVRAVDGTKVVLFAAHFRSKVSDDPGRRLAEAVATRVILDQRALDEPAALVVLGGDLNDSPGSPPLDALTLNGGLLRAAADLPVADQATYFFNGRGEAIDHLLQASTAAGAVVPRSAHVWKDGRGWGGSDHYALTADYELTSVP